MAGLVTVGAGIGFGILANQDEDRAAAIRSGLGSSACSRGPSPSCRALDMARDDQARDRTLNLVFLGVGAAATVTGVVLLLWPSSAARAVALVPAASGTGAVLQWQGAL